MSTITETNARTITGDYVANGNATHFLFGGKTIKGLKFTRKQLNDVFRNDLNNELFIMLALSTDTGTNKKHLNIVVANMHNNAMDTGTMIVSSSAPYTGNVIYIAEEIKIKSSKNVSKNVLLGAGEPITPEELARMQTAFATATIAHLSCTNTDRIKCYRLDRQDLIDLKLDAVTTINQNDIFMFMPVIRPVRASDTIPLTKEYVSLAVSLFDPATEKVSGTIVEYCLPCPSACATNYWF